jgi:CelD/BcsL family acetyltransferase involved in cellulose biosynthesis
LEQASARETGHVAAQLEGGVESIDGLADEWRALCAEGPCDEPFYRPEWIAAYVRAFAPRARLRLLTARADGRLRAVLPLVAEWGSLHGLRLRKLRGAANVHSCRFDLVHGVDDAEGAAGAIWALLRCTPGWDALELRDVPCGGGAELLLAAAERDGYPVGRWELSPGPYVRLRATSESPDSAFAHVSPKLLGDLRRQRRKLDAEAGGPLRLTRIERADRNDLERFYDLERAGWKGTEGTAIASDPGTRAFYDLVADSAAQNGYLCLYVLSSGERTLAMHYGLAHNGCFYLLKPAYDEAYRSYSPGNLLVQEVIRDSVERGRHEVDLMTDSEVWKTRWSTDDRHFLDGYVFRRGIRGRAFHAWKFRAMHAARRFKHRLRDRST